MPETSKPTLPGTYKPSAAKALDALGVCIYGRPGVGKTTLLGTMPGNGLVLDIPQIEGGTFVLADSDAHIDIKPIVEWDDIDAVFNYLQKDTYFHWVAIDSLTAMTELAKRKTLKERNKALTEDPRVISQPEWGKIGSLVAELIYKFRTLQKHTIWIAQERTYGGEDSGSPTRVGPSTSPAAESALEPSMTIIGRLSVESDAGTYQRRLRIGPHPLYITKCRARPGLTVPSLIADPNLKTLLSALLGKGEMPKEVDEFAGILQVIN